MRRIGFALAAAVFAGVGFVSQQSLAQDRVPGDVIRDRIRDRIESRRLDRVPRLGTAAKAESGGPGHESIIIKGQVRTFLRFTPNSVLVKAKRASVVFALHGGKGTASQLQSYLGLNAVAEKEGFIVVYPQGEGKRWNDGRTVEANGGADVSSADDIGFLNTLADALVAQGVADPKRIYIMGLSNGGFMTLALACAPSSRFAAFGAVIASIPAAKKAECKPGAPLNVVMINGTEDKLIRYDGAPGMFGLKGNLPPAEAAGHLAGLSGCKEPVETELPDRDPADATRVVKRAWAACNETAKVEFLTVRGGGHQPPVIGGSSNVLVDAFLGTRSHDIDTAETVWDFFKRSQR
jgi:polyhydroxybutyrate depolymerase